MLYGATSNGGGDNSAGSCMILGGFHSLCVIVWSGEQRCPSAPFKVQGS